MNLTQTTFNELKGRLKAARMAYGSWYLIYLVNFICYLGTYNT